MKRDAAVEAVFQPVRPPTTFEETVERLGTAIRVGLLAPGSKLPPERQLAEELRISRSTLRQALTTLVQSGHLKSVRGPVRRHLRRRAAAALRERGEDPLGRRRLGGARPPGRDRGRLGDARRRARRGEPTSTRSPSWSSGWPRPTDFEHYRRADIRFHIGVAEAARSPRLVTEMTEVQGQMSDLIARIAHPEEVLTRSNAQHRKLVACCARGDAAAARGADAHAHPRHRAHPRRASV